MQLETAATVSPATLLPPPPELATPTTTTPKTAAITPAKAMPTSFATVVHPAIDPTSPPPPLHHHQQHHQHHNNNSQAAEYHQLRTALAGAVAAAVGRVFVQPLDVLKIRFQLQVEPLHYVHTGSSKYTSMWQAMQTIAREEGVRAFWKGHNPAQGLSVAYGVAQFWTYERLKSEAKHLNVYAAHRDSTNFVCGAVAGALANAVITPLDVIRTRLIAQDNRKGYANTLDAARTIVRAEGGRGLYRGLGPAMLQVAPLTGINFMAYNKMCVWSVHWLELESKG